jgi:hypothetical protein
LASEDKYLIELKYDDLLVAEAENLLDKNAVIDFSNPEKHLYLFVIHDGEDIETEIHKPFTKIQKSTCPCQFHTKHKICKHVIAGLLYLRNQQASNKKSSSVTQNKKPKTLNTHTILQHVEREELIHFVRNYAKSDAKFALQLKIHFARKVDLPDNREKYKILLDSIIKPYNGKNKPSASELKAFLSVTEELIGQVQDNLAIRQYEEAIHVFEAGFYKFMYVRHYFGMESPVFTMQNEAWHDIVLSFYQLDIPFVLKKSLTSYLLDIALLSFYRFTDVQKNVVRILAAHISKKESSQLTDSLIDKISHVPVNEKPIIMALVCLLVHHVPVPIRQLAEAPGFAVLPWLKYMKALGMNDSVKKEITLLSDKPGFDRELFLIQCEIELEENNRQEAVVSAYRYFKATGNYSIVNVMISGAGKEQWLSTLKNIFEKLILNDATVKPIYVIQYYQMQEEWNHLCNYLSLHDDIQHLHACAQVLYKYRPADLEALYEKNLLFYLTNHMGDTSYAYIGAVIHTLGRLRLFTLKNNLKDKISQKYKDRKGLIQFLENLH